jgi:phenylpropionate dioxygenase-like ring-hydroxylating dioxygenase large terminal subunit
MSSTDERSVVSAGVWDRLLPGPGAAARPAPSAAPGDVAAGETPVAAPGLRRAPEDSGYELTDRPEPPPIPNGWYAACASADLEPGQVQSFIAVGRELVVFRGEHGAAHVLDAHCPHMGAHLGGGQVAGETLQCPYHQWSYDGDGVCTEIPYSSGRIPARACVRSYPVQEQDDLVLFWFHAADVAPQYQVPAAHTTIGADWTGPRTHRGELVASLQDMAENNVDYTHFYFVHGRAALDESTSKFTTDGPFSTVVETFADGLVFTRHTYGPGVATIAIPNLATMVTTTTPIDRRHVRLLWQFYFPPGMEAFADDILDGVIGQQGLAADEPIWRDKIFMERPLLVKGDGPIPEFRRWYEQFYDGSRPTPATPGDPT